MLLLLRIKGNAGITATHARCLAQPQHSGQQLRSCLLSQPRLEGMAPKVKKADKTEAAAKAKAAANKKKDQGQHGHPAEGRAEEVAGSKGGGD